MRTLHKSMGFVLGMVLAAFAGSSFAAPAKTFYAVVSPLPPLVACPSPTAGYCAQFTMTFYNVSPNPSTINSIEIVPPVFQNGPTVTILNVSPGSPSQSLGPHGGVVVNSIPGIKNKAPGNVGVFTIDVSFSSIPTTCTVGIWGAYANAGNAYPQGDEFAPDNTQMQLNAGVGCQATGTVNCGEFFYAGGGQVADVSGYAKVTISDKLKDGTTACVGSMAYGYVNTLFDDNKVVVVLSNESAAFTVDIVSYPLPVDPDTGWPSRRVRVATTYNASTGWDYVDAKACTCTAAKSSCMPAPLVVPQLCVVDYAWIVTGSLLAKHYATINGIGNDPAMGWE